MENTDLSLRCRILNNRSYLLIILAFVGYACLYAVTPDLVSSTELQKTDKQPIIATQSLSPEIIKAQADAKKVDDASTQFFFDYVFKVLLLVVGVSLIIWLFPQIQEFSIPFGSGSFTAKKAPKEPLPSTPPAAAPQPIFPQVVETLKSTFQEGPSRTMLVNKLEESEVYQAVGIDKDSLYVCHRAKKIPRSEYYRVQIYLDADNDSILDKVEKVVYKLHPKFSQSEIEKTENDRKNQFQHEIVAWGEFMLYAIITLKGTTNSIQLKRYLNFY